MKKLKVVWSLLVIGGLGAASAAFGPPSFAAPVAAFTVAPDGLLYAPPTGTRQLVLRASSAASLKITVDRSGKRPSGVRFGRDGLPTSPIKLTCSGLGTTAANPAVTCDLSQVGPKLVTVPLCFNLQSETADFDQRCFEVRTGRGAGLGDSYGSGEGGGAYLRSKAANTRGYCDRSRYAASRQLFQQHLPQLDYELLACTGFTSTAIRTVKVSSERAPNLSTSRTQLDYLDRDVTLLTLSAGGNDAGFATNVEACLRVTRCDTDPVFTKGLEDSLAKLPDLLDALYKEVRAKAPNARVLVQGYPYLFPKEGTCRRTDIRILSAGTITPEEYHYLMGREEWANTLLATAAREHSFTFVDTAQPDSPDSFYGHWSCGSSSWIHDLTLASGAAKVVKLSLAALHPTRNGQGHIASLLWDGVLRTPATPAAVWTPAEAFRTEPARNPSPDDAGHPDVWRFQQGRGLDASTYALLPNYSTGACGRPGLVKFSNPVGFPLVTANNTGGDLDGVTGPGCDSAFSIPKGGVGVHPYADDVIVSWTSPIDGTVSITGGLKDADPNGGNGVSWQVAMQDPAAANPSALASGSVPNGGSSAFDGLGEIRVSPGTRLLLIVDSAGDPDYDLTAIDLAVKTG